MTSLQQQCLTLLRILFSSAGSCQILPWSYIRDLMSLHILAFPNSIICPTEVRFSIWRASIPPGRTIQLELSPDYIILGTHTPPDPLFHTCSGSRNEMFKHYKVLRHNFYKQPIYFRPDIDTIYIRQHPFHFRPELWHSTFQINDATNFFRLLKGFSPGELSDLSLIKHLILKSLNLSNFIGWLHGIDHHTRYTEDVAGRLMYFSNLETLTLVTNSKIYERPLLSREEDTNDSLFPKLRLKIPGFPMPRVSLSEGEDKHWKAGLRQAVFIQQHLAKGPPDFTLSLF